MFFNLTKFIAQDETILLRFGISLRYVIVSSTLWTLFLGGLAFYFHRWEIDFLAQVLLITLVVVILGYLIRFLGTSYFATDQKIYKVIRLGFTKVTSAKKTEIDDMKIQQGFLENLFFDTGTIKFNTPGSTGFEVILPKVKAPYETKQDLYQLWDV